MSERYDFYRPIHKGIRFGSAGFLARLGAADWAAETRWRPLLADLGAFLILAREHLEHEDVEIIPSLHACAPALARSLDEDHEHHADTFADLERLIRAVEAAVNDADRAAAGQLLYLRFAEYFADDIVHMQREELEAMPVFQAHFSDGDLEAMETRIIQSIPFEKLLAYFRLMIPAATPADRAKFLRYVQNGAPNEVFETILTQSVKPSLSPEDWQRLAGDLKVAA